MSYLLLKSGGILERTNEQSEITDVSDCSFSYLYETIQLDDDVKFKDIISLVSKNIEIYSVIFSTCYLKELVEESLKKCKVNIDDKIDFLELYYIYNIDDDGKINNTLVEFHGITNPKCEEEIRWAIDLTPLNQIIDLPLKLKSTLTFVDKQNQVFEYLNPDYNLGDVLYGIFHECSWHGSPKQRNKRSRSIKNILKNIKKNPPINLGGE